MRKKQGRELREIPIKGCECIVESVYPGNKLVLSRYSLLTLIPLNLFEQFQRTSNIWFLIVSIFQLIPFQLNPTDSWTTIVPLSILLVLTLIKDAYTDNWLRKKDKIFNNLQYSVWNGDRFVPIKSEKILVGQFIRVQENQIVPADLVIVSSTNEGNIFLDMSRLIGYTSLAPKSPVEKFAKSLKLDTDFPVINKISGKLSLSEPNSDYNDFLGSFKFDKIPGAIDIVVKNIMFKGGILKGEKSILGLVAYCGPETKLQLNTNPLKRKQSRLEKIVNRLVLYILFVLIFMVFISVIGFYHISQDSDSQDGVLNPIITFTLLYNNIIPISLFMVIDIIRLLSSFICSKLNKDIIFNTESVNENLGQVEYLLMDKTGSITLDKLLVKTCIIGEKKYLFNSENKEIDPVQPESEMNLLAPEALTLSTSRNLNFEHLKEDLNTQGPRSPVHQFIRCMALCNNLNQRGDTFLGSYEEIALVESCKDLGFDLKIPQWDIFELKDSGSTKLYFRIVAKIPFNSDRKRCRVLLEEPDGSGVLYIKGSPEGVISLLNISENTKSAINSHLKSMKENGLRAIIVSYRKIAADDLLEIKSKIQRIKKSVLNTESRIEAMFKELEFNLLYLGIVGLSEALQPDSQKTISDLTKAGIKFWLLSSDSLNSTVLSAKESGIIDKNSRIIELALFNNEVSCSKALIKAIESAIFNERRTTYSASSAQVMPRRRSRVDESDSSNPSSSRQEHIWHDLPNSFLLRKTTVNDEDIKKILERPFDPQSIDYCLVVDRKTFLVALMDLECRKLLVCLLVCAKSVCFADLMPIDKGRIVRLLKENVAYKPLVVSVGSGEGDISMVQSSDVGIGIRYREDSLVLNYSDVTIQRFSQLSYLLLCEGHWMYTRISKAILLYLYKNFFLTLLLIAYTFICDYSGTSIFNASLLVGFNLIFTSLPILVIGIFDEDISQEKIQKFPRIYSLGVLNTMFCTKKVLSYVAISVIQGILLIIMMFQVFPIILTSSGQTEDLTGIGTVTYVILVVAVLMQINAQTFCYTWLYLLSQVLSIASLALFLVVVTETSFPSDELLGVGYFFRNSPAVLFNIFLTSVLCVLPAYAFFTYLDLFTSKFITKFRVSYSLAIPQYSKLDQYKKSLGSLYRNTSNWNSKSLQDMFSMKKFTLRFNLKHIEKKFAENYIAENLTLFKWTIAILWTLIILWTVFGAIVMNDQENYILARIIISSACSLMLFILWSNHFIKNFHRYILLMIFIALFTKFALEISFAQTSILATALVPSVTFLILNVHWLGILMLNILNVLLFIVSISVEFSQKYDKSDATLLSVSLVILLIGITLTSALVGYFLERSKRVEYTLNNKTHSGIEQIDSVLKIMLPPFVRNRVKEGARYIAEDQGEVTILFCDICDFDGICKDYSPQELTSFLDYIFSSIDLLCEKIGVTKIETVGKTYMACSGLKDSDKDISQELRQHPHARRCIELALAIIQDVNSIQLKNGNKLQVKIGINTGPVSAGVVGHHKPQFSLVGDTVNTASRMCSTLDTSNTIQISATSYSHLSHYEDLEFCQSIVTAKGKGEMNVYKVTEATVDNSDIAGGLLGQFGSSSALINIPSSYNENGTELKLEEKTSKFNRKSLMWKEEILQRQNSNLIQHRPLLTVKFDESDQEKEFRIKKLEKNYYSIMVSLVIAICILLLMTIFSICEWFVLREYTNPAVIISRSIVVIFLGCVLSLHSRIYIKIYYPYLIILSLLLMITTVMLELSYEFKLPQDIIGLEIMYIIVILNHCSAASLPLVIFVSVITFIPWIALAVNTVNQSLHLTNALLVASFSVINFKGIFQQEKNDRANHNLKILADIEIEESENLLKQMMPAHVLENLEKGKSVTDRLHNVTLIFADIVGFTNWSASKKPEEIVKMLSNLFTRFDKLCVEYDVYKVHTIGDCYVVMGDVGRKNRDPSQECLNVLNMAYRMIEVINEENAKHKSELDMRIGIHTGEVIAGVIGTSIVRYDIWGPDVLIANKMESNGTPGKVKCSEDTKLMIENRDPDGFEFEESKKIDVPIIGVTKNTYYVKRK